MGRLGYLIRTKSVHRSPAPPIYANDRADNVQLSTGMRFLDGNGTFPPSIRCISHIMTIYTRFDDSTTMDGDTDTIWI